jgi:hypothetical protein
MIEGFCFVVSLVLTCFPLGYCGNPYRVSKKFPIVACSFLQTKRCGWWPVPISFSLKATQDLVY